MRGKGEDECLAKLGCLLGCEFTPQSQYCPLDGVAELYCCEIKQRNLKKNSFPTTIVGKNKIDYWREKYPERMLYLFFRFEDGDYYYLWNDEDYIEFDKGGLRHLPRDYYFVPNTLLTEF